MVFVELIDAMVTVHPKFDRAEIFAAIREREEKMSTWIGYGVAVPHASCKGIDNFAGAIGISQHGIDYGALDGKPVYVVFLLILKVQAEEKHLQILNLVFKFAKSETIAMMKNAKNAEDIHAMLSRVQLYAGSTI